ncbi:MAG: hypothetical protein EBT21_04960 [Actinobacteria bacterium]|nr:hypothetical protein [Actinomycetota bacterium]
MEFRAEEPHGHESRPLVAPLISLPDFSPFRKDEYYRTETRRFPFPGNDGLTGVVEYSQLSDRPDINVRLSAETADGQQALVFNSKIRDIDRDWPLDQQLVPESGPGTHAIIFTRMVDEGFRGRGLGRTAVELLEETIRRIGDARPSGRARWLEVRTGLASTSSLVVDPTWVKRWTEDNYESLRYDQLGRLLDRSAHVATNLGFVPAPGEERLAMDVLTNGATDLNDMPHGQGTVLFHKKLDTTVTFKPRKHFRYD